MPNVRLTIDPTKVVFVSDTEYRDLLAQKLIYAVEGGEPIDYPDFSADQYAELSKLIGGFRAPIRDFAAKAKLAVDPLTIAVAGDSTGDENAEWVKLFIDDYRTARPWLAVDYFRWNDGTQANDLTALQAGSDQTVVVQSAGDKFSRTATSLVGTSGDHTYGAWTGSDSFSINGSDAVYKASAGFSRIPGPGVAATKRRVYGRVTVDTNATGTAKKINLGMSASGTSRFSLWIAVSTTGVVTWGVDGQFAPTFAAIVTGGGTPLMAASVQTVDWSLQFDGTAVTASLNGVTANGTLTTAQATAVATMDGAYMYPELSPIGWSVPEIRVDSTVVERSTVKLSVYNGSRAGSTLAYQQSRLTAMYPVAPDLLIVSSSHNYVGVAASDYLAALTSFVSAFRALYPKTAIALSSQNPEVAPVVLASRASHRARCLAIAPYAKLSGFEYIPVWEAFEARSDLGTILVRADGTHPTVAGAFDDLTDPNNGQYVWKTVVNSWLSSILSAA